MLSEVLRGHLKCHRIWHHIPLASYTVTSIRIVLLDIVWYTMVTTSLLEHAICLWEIHSATFSKLHDLTVK